MRDSATPGYSLPARVLHWLTAVLVLTMIPIGIVMANVKLGRFGDTLYDLHRSIGTLLLPIVAFRLAWRLSHPPPPLPPELPRLQQRLATGMHQLLYALLIIQPIVGWIATSAYGAPINVFWLFELPPIWPADQVFSAKMFLIHRWLGIAMAVLLCGHIGAALYHQFIRRDQVIYRMVRS